MRLIKDKFGRRVRLTTERLTHMRAFHPELTNSVRRIQKTLSEPDRIIRSTSDPDAQLFYRFFRDSPVGSKFFCVVVKADKDDYFVVTAYFTDKVKRGEQLWPENSR